MHRAVNVEELGNEWVDIVRCCCPNLQSATWSVRAGDMVMSAHFVERRNGVERRSERTVEILLRAELLESFLTASLMQKTYTTSRLVQCVVAAQAAPGTGWPVRRSLTRADLAMESI
jgi:hypothetical protein